LALNTALGEFASSLGITKKLREYSIITSWNVIVGEQIARVAIPQRIENRVLFVTVASAPWRSELTMRRRELIEKINSSVVKQAIQDIRFR
jgi:predicted nucleic acid-binding Zn ribbon protein